MDPLEPIHKAVEREIMEETGVEAKFESICAMREQVDHKFDQAGDFYFVALCTPKG